MKRQWLLGTMAATVALGLILMAAQPVNVTRADSMVGTITQAQIYLMVGVAGEPFTTPDYKDALPILTGVAGFPSGDCVVDNQNFTVCPRNIRYTLSALKKLSAD